MNNVVEEKKWHQRLTRTGYFVGALLFHVVLFLLVATCIIFRPPTTDDRSSFLRFTVKPPPPPPPAPPASGGGDVANPLEPATEVAPPPSVLSVVSTLNPSAFSLKAVKVDVPNLPTATVAPTGTGLAGAEAPGAASGAGSNPFGSESASGSAQFQGFLYDLKQTPDRKPTGMSPGLYHARLKQFIQANWDPSVLATYYKSPEPLNTPDIFIPTLSADNGPKAFGVDAEVKPNAYVVWYKVTASPSQDGTYHFVGIADDILAVRVNGRTVLDGSLFSIDDTLRKDETKYPLVNFRPSCNADSSLYVGAPFHASAGEAVDIDVLIGEEPGGYSNYFLFIQRDESTYARQSNGTPLLPVFQLDANPIHPDGKPLSFPPFSSTAEPWSGASR